MMKNAISMIGISSRESSRTTGDNTTTSEGTGSSFQKVRGSSKWVFLMLKLNLN